jgi:hypothetical protein
MWEIGLLVVASLIGIVWLLLPAEDEIRSFFNWDK